MSKKSRKKHAPPTSSPPTPIESEAKTSTSVYIAKRLVPVLLCTVAVVQNVCAHTINLTTWKGGGFGLFASHDQLRFAKVYLIAGSRRLPLGVAKDLHVLRFLALPSPDRGNSVAHSLYVEEGSIPRGRVKMAAYDIEYDVETSVMSCREMASGDSRRQF